MAKLTHGSLFSGIGGPDLAAEWMGWENIFHCEINPFGRQVLNHYWPNAISYDDIKQTDFTIHRGRIGESNDVANTMQHRCRNRTDEQKHECKCSRTPNTGTCSNHEVTTNTTCQRRRQNERIGNRKPKQFDKNLSQGAWRNFPTQSPVCGRNDGLPTRLATITVRGKRTNRTLTTKQAASKIRNESLKAYGNAIVPQLIHMVFKAIQQYEDLYSE